VSQDSRTFAAVGKAFLLKPKEAVEKKLSSNIAACEQTLGVCSKTLEYLEKQHADAQTNFKELIKSIESRG
jgi:hypothetical protein